METTPEKKQILSYIDDDDDDEVPNKNRDVIFIKSIFVYGWGKNKYGELGLGHTTDTTSPSAIQTLQSQIITQISSGGKHTAVVTREGKLLICGTDVLGLLGNEKENRKWKEQHTFQIMTNLDSEYITQVACAEFHSLCLTVEGEVYAWGGILHSKLGQSTGLPSKITALSTRKIIQIACGDHHSVALSELGEVFTWGGGGQYNRGQCGHGDIKEIETPKRVDFFKKRRAFQVACGGYHTMVLCEGTYLYGFGKGSYGQCGYGISEDTSYPKLVKFSKKSIYYEQPNIKKGDLTSNAFNLNQTSEDTQNVSKGYTCPVIIKDVKCGGEHTIVLSSFGRVYTFGHGYTGQLGLGNNHNYDRPIIVKSMINKTVNQIAAGWSHSMLLTSEGNLYVAGCGKYGELGLLGKENRHNFTLLRGASMMNLTNIYAGGHHSWLVTDSITPERLDYESPSPLDSGNFTLTCGKSQLSPRELSQTVSKQDLIAMQNYSTLSKPNTKLNIDLLEDTIKLPSIGKFQFQVAYSSDLQLSHRFIRFGISNNSRYKAYSYTELAAMVDDFLKKDKGNLIHRLQDDNEILSGSNISDFPSSPALQLLLKEIKSSTFYESVNIDFGLRRSFSLTIVYDYNKNEDMKAMKSEIEVHLMKNDNRMNQNMYQVRILNDEDISNSEMEKVLSNWVVDFCFHFSELFLSPEDYPKFLELRPHCFLN